MPYGGSDAEPDVDAGDLIAAGVRRSGPWASGRRARLLGVDTLRAQVHEQSEPWSEERVFVLEVLGVDGCSIEMADLGVYERQGFVEGQAPAPGAPARLLIENAALLAAAAVGAAIVNL